MNKPVISDYSHQAGAYARFRWEYAQEAITAICTFSGVGAGSQVADIGAGTGMLSRWFVERGIEVWALEPDPAMLGVAAQLLGGRAHYHGVQATAEATALAAGSIDLITVGRALHWFHPVTSRAEFQRILKPDGWLAVLAVRNLDKDLVAATERLKTESGAFDPASGKRKQPAADMAHYFMPQDLLELHYPALQQETWEQFLGRLSTFSGAPQPATPAFHVLEQAAWQVFHQFSVDGQLNIPVETQVYLGRLQGLGRVR